MNSQPAALSEKKAHDLSPAAAFLFGAAEPLIPKLPLHPDTVPAYLARMRALQAALLRNYLPTMTPAVAHRARHTLAYLSAQDTDPHCAWDTLPPIPDASQDRAWDTLPLTEEDLYLA